MDLIAVAPMNSITVHDCLNNLITICVPVIRDSIYMDFRVIRVVLKPLEFSQMSATVYS